MVEKAGKEGKRVSPEITALADSLPGTIGQFRSFLQFPTPHIRSVVFFKISNFVPVSVIKPGVTLVFIQGAERRDLLHSVESRV
jgi:hypothetical protein